MVTIGEFIIARLDDDEFLAAHMVRRRGRGSGGALEVGEVACRTWDPRRVLASCAAMRLVVVDHRVATGGSARCDCGRPGSASPPCVTLRALAMEWADHPDYRQAWRPHPWPRQRQSA